MTQVDDLAERALTHADFRAYQIDAYDQALLNNVREAQVELQIEQLKQVEGVCATIRLRIEQDLVMSRQAFIGSLTLESDDEDLSQIALNLVITDLAGNVVASNVFGISNDYLSGIDALDGTDGLAASGSFTSEDTFLPSTLAAPEGPAAYRIGGTLSFRDVTESHDHLIQLDPVTVHVLPQAELTLDYFQERNVVSDDPFTDDVVEPASPFLLGVLLSNDGRGTADSLRIESAQPKIIENEKGLLVDFKIIGSQVDGESPSGSLTAVFGDIGPGDTAAGAWFLECCGHTRGAVGDGRGREHRRQFRLPRPGGRRRVPLHAR